MLLMPFFSVFPAAHDRALPPRRWCSGGNRHHQIHNHRMGAPDYKPICKCTTSASSGFVWQIVVLRTRVSVATVIWLLRGNG
jgi:hypothetical protein